MSRVETPPEAAPTSKRPPTWQLAVSALLIICLGAQFFAGWKFANGQTYPIVGSAMFNGPPIPGSTTSSCRGCSASRRRVSGSRWTSTRSASSRSSGGAGSSATSRTCTQEQADAAAAELAAAYTARTGAAARPSLELWRVPALTDDFERGRFVRTVEL